ncbi:tRNA glutamyl-Q(34) synthetase GluQRS [Alteromonas pelagimontana]|uniref:Glutamyl-Q tRNA(Asp) synthetase n=1 Tax=Alteromonas pelagimontana TaxID=1858656 RepID=A0A6M4MEJ6_9ALTE|nr:tRNA glutamyl-Q(34) synthetase GluQRS [Alteromonas pelagimontana]QJR81437.1 tRNA glutamyl-Q(34) synthetase GluQRS [Alteromonas pelagimontana]
MTTADKFPSYIGRFAPSPSGPLHFGSLIAAVASYLDARAHQGKWLLRIEDIDTPRCIAGADKAICEALVAHELLWDGDILYQSQRLAEYQSVVDHLLQLQQAYYCTCTRKEIKAQGGVYPGTCRLAKRDSEGAAIRVKLDNPVTTFNDRIRGRETITEAHALEDTIIKRRDGLFAYNLVVVLDDIYQQVTHVVRGSDILPTTATHLSLYAILGKPAPQYAHIPVAAVEKGRKLSKQNRAAPLNLATPSQNLMQALAFLNIIVPDYLRTANCQEILHWAVAQWNCNKLPPQSEIIVGGCKSTYHSGAQ